MVEEKLLTIREVAVLLDISERQVMELAESGQIPAYKIGGVYLRFRRQQIEDFKKHFRIPTPCVAAPEKYPWKEKVSDFFYFNDFYILSILIVILLLVVILQGY